MVSKPSYVLSLPKKMKFLHKYGTRDIEVARAKRELYLYLAIASVVAVFFAAMIFISKLRPRLNPEQENAFSEVATRSTEVISATLEKKKERLAVVMEQIGRQTAEPLNAEGLVLLEEAIELQRYLIDNRLSEIATRQDLNLLEELTGRYALQRGTALAESSLRLEAEARTHHAEQNATLANEKISQAIALQETINRDFPQSPDRDPSRLHQLKDLREEWLTRPVHESIEAMFVLAQSAAAREEFAEARELAHQALLKQRELNQNYRTSRYASLGKARAIENFWDSMKSAREISDTENLLSVARKALASDNSSMALDNARRAEVLIDTTLEQYPDQQAALEILRQEAIDLQETAASNDAFKKWKEIRLGVRTAIRTQQFGQLQNGLSEWFRQTQYLFERFPNSQLLVSIDPEEVKFLHQLRRELPSLIQTLETNLLPVPGNPQRLLYRTEVPQSLFERIMEFNPSLNVGPNLPVESVTWEEAKRFAAKVSWILARPATLPDREIYLAAVGSPSPKDLRSGSWHSLNSDRQTQPVNRSSPLATGFSDLLGNVSEWLASNTNDTAITLGGSLRDSIGRLGEIPQEERLKEERNRFVGFRIAVSDER